MGRFFGRNPLTARTKAHITMSETSSVLGGLDRLCTQFAMALQGSELQIYTTLALMIVLSILLFPPRNDPDQV